VNAGGALVGIATSGGAGRFEAIPASRIPALQDASGDAHVARSAELGAAYRDCIIDVEEAQRARGALPAEVTDKIESRCSATGNRQLFDLAGQALGRARKFDAAIALFERSLDTDPNAVNARIGLVITLMFARRNEDALEHVRWLVDVVPRSTEVQRFAVHVGKEAGDMALAEKGLALIRQYNPAQYEAAKRFLEMPPPKPR
jgi:tetratricopeptide (TPR) repeat protein